MSGAIGVGRLALGILDLLEHLAHARLHQGAVGGGGLAVSSAEAFCLPRIELIAAVHGAIVAAIRGQRQSRAGEAVQRACHFATRALIVDLGASSSGIVSIGQASPTDSQPLLAHEEAIACWTRATAAASSKFGAAG